MKMYDKARDYALKAKKKFLEINNIKGVGVSLYRLALIYVEEKDFSDAIQTLLEAKKMFIEINDMYFLTQSNLLLGKCFRDTGNIHNAIDIFNEALVSAQTMGDVILTSSIIQNIATIYYDKQEYTHALSYMIQADSGYLIVRDRKALMENSANLLAVYCKLNMPDSAIKYFTRFRQLSDSIYNDELSKSLAEIQQKYESSKQDKEISELNLQNATRENRILSLKYLNEITNLKLKNSSAENEEKSQSLKLALAEKEQQQTNIKLLKINDLRNIESEKEREKLLIVVFLACIVVLSVIFILFFLIFQNKKKRQQAILSQKAAELKQQVSENNIKALRSQMNPHFIFNCIQTILRLLDDSKINETRKSLEQFSILTRAVLENSKKKRVQLKEELETCQQFIELEVIRFKNPFSYKINVASGIDEKTTLIPPLILQPFIENAIKHGFRDSEKPCRLKIEVKIENEMLVCIIEDNGVGRQKNSNIKNISGFKKESLGIKITEERLHLLSITKNIKAYLLIEDLIDDNKNPRGTRVKIFLPYELTT
jgi:tetratricopeptide (TPR) repeat protein